MGLPIKFVIKNLEKAKELTIFGHSFEELSHDELIAVAVEGWARQERIIKENKEQRDFLFSLIKK